MATFINAAVMNMLEESIERLYEELSPLKQQMQEAKEGMFITHDEDKIIVYTSLRFKAYVPKKYDGWNASFFEWDKTSEIQFLLDLPIDMI